MSKAPMQSVQSEIKVETSKSVESLQRSLRLLAETEDIGTYVLEELHIQGEKMDKINENLTTIERKQQESSKLLTYLTGIWSRMTSRFQDPLLVEQPTDMDQKVTMQSPIKVSQQNTNRVWGSPISILPSSATPKQHQDYIDSELMIEKLDQALSGLTTKANQIHETLVTQNEKLDIMDGRVDIANTNMTRLNKKINTIIR